MVMFAQKMNMQTVAEFVASEEIYLTCKELGIDYFQGYHFSEPQPFASLVIQ